MGVLSVLLHSPAQGEEVEVPYWARYLGRSHGVTVYVWRAALKHVVAVRKGNKAVCIAVEDRLSNAETKARQYIGLRSYTFNAAQLALFAEGNEEG